MNKKKRALALGLAATQLTSLTAIVAPLTAATAFAAEATPKTFMIPDEDITVVKSDDKELDPIGSAGDKVNIYFLLQSQNENVKYSKVFVGNTLVDLGTGDYETKYKYQFQLTADEIDSTSNNAIKLDAIKAKVHSVTALELTGKDPIGGGLTIDLSTGTNAIRESEVTGSNDTKIENAVKAAVKANLENVDEGDYTVAVTTTAPSNGTPATVKAIVALTNDGKTKYFITGSSAASNNDTTTEQVTVEVRAWKAEKTQIGKAFTATTTVALEGIIDSNAGTYTLTDTDKTAIKKAATDYLTAELAKNKITFGDVLAIASSNEIDDSGIANKKVGVKYSLKANVSDDYAIEGDDDVTVTVPVANAKAYTFKSIACGKNATVDIKPNNGGILGIALSDGDKFTDGKYTITVTPNSDNAFKEAPEITSSTLPVGATISAFTKDGSTYKADVTFRKATVDTDLKIAVTGDAVACKTLTSTVTGVEIGGSAAGDKISWTYERQKQDGTTVTWEKITPDTTKIFAGDVLRVTVDTKNYKFDENGLKLAVGGGAVTAYVSGSTPINVTEDNLSGFSLTFTGTLVEDTASYEVAVPSSGDTYTVKAKATVDGKQVDLENKEYKAGTSIQITVEPIEGYVLNTSDTKFDGAALDGTGTRLSTTYKVQEPKPGNLLDLGKMLTVATKEKQTVTLTAPTDPIEVTEYTQAEYEALVADASKVDTVKKIRDAIAQNIEVANESASNASLEEGSYKFTYVSIINGKMKFNFELTDSGLKKYELTNQATPSADVTVKFASVYDVDATVKDDAAVTVTWDKDKKSGKDGDTVKITVAPLNNTVSLQGVSIEGKDDIVFTKDKDAATYSATYTIAAADAVNGAIKLVIVPDLRNATEFKAAEAHIAINKDDNTAELTFDNLGTYEITCDKETQTLAASWPGEKLILSDEYADKELSIVKKGDETHADSAPIKVKVPAKAAAPTNLKYTASQANSDTEGFKIDNLATTMEYKLSTDTEYKAVEKTTDKLMAGTYDIRVKATASLFASDPVELVVSADKVTNIEAKAGALASADVNYASNKTTRSIKITFSNSGANSPANVTLDTLPEGWKISNMPNNKVTVAAAATKEITVTVPAKDAGKYSGVVTFTDDSETPKTISVNVEFEIKKLSQPLTVSNAGAKELDSNGGAVTFTLGGAPSGIKTTVAVTPDTGVTIKDGKATFPANTTDKDIVYKIKATADDKNYTFTSNEETITVLKVAALAAGEHRITVGEIENGAITVDKAVAVKDGIVTVTATPNEGYEFESFTVTDKDGGEVETNAEKMMFKMPEKDVTITATFKAEAGADYKLEAAKAENGTVSFTVGGAAATTAKAGDTVTVVTTPEDGYKAGTIAVKTASGKTVEVTGNTFVMPVEDVTVTVTFVTEDTPIETEYAITAAAAENGTVSFEVEGAAAAAAKKGDVVTIVAEAADGYKVGTITVTGASGAVAVTDNTFEMPAEAVTVTVEFVEKSAPVETAHAIDLAETTHGTFKAQVGGKDAKEAVKGDEVTIVTTPASGYRDGTISVKTKSGKTVTVRSKKFTMPDEDVTITVTFSRKSSGGSSGGSASRPSGGSSSGSSGSTSTTPSVSDSATVSTIKGTTSGGTAKLDGVVVMTTDAIKAAADNKVNLEVKVDDDYTWTIDADKLSDKNSVLRLSVSSATVNETETAKIKKSTGAEDRNEKAFSVVADNLGTGATLKVKTVAKSTDNAKKFANLYKTNADGTLTFVAAAPIDKDGNAVLPITDKGTYTIVASTETKMPGDINNDCKVDLTDLTAMLTSYVNNTNPKSFDNYKLDHDNSGELALSDLVAMLRDYSNGKL